MLNLPTNYCVDSGPPIAVEQDVKQLADRSLAVLLDFLDLRVMDQLHVLAGGSLRLTVSYPPSNRFWTVDLSLAMNKLSLPCPCSFDELQPPLCHFCQIVRRHHA